MILPRGFSLPTPFSPLYQEAGELLDKEGKIFYPRDPYGSDTPVPLGSEVTPSPLYFLSSLRACKGGPSPSLSSHSHFPFACDPYEGYAPSPLFLINPKELCPGSLTGF